MGPCQLLLGGLAHLRLPAKHDRYSFHVSEGIGNIETRLVGVATGTLCKYVKAHPNSSPSKTRFNPDESPYRKVSTPLVGVKLLLELLSMLQKSSHAIELYTWSW
jgi:hypothetical protein